MFRSALLILSGNITASVLGLARNLFVARLISIENYGITATLLIAVAIIEMATAFGLSQQIIQSRRGNEAAFQAALHGFSAIRGVMAGVILFLLAWPMARFLDLEEVLWAYQLLAIIPILHGLSHFDIHRLNRKMVYLPGILTSTVPAAVGLASVWPLWTIWPDYRVMLFSMLIQSVTTLAMSHLVAERPYRLAFDRQVIFGTMGFGWPLLLNNLLLFAVMHGEKLIIGRELGMAALAVFAMGFTLTLTPTLVMAKSIQTFFLPQLSAVQDDPARFNPLGRAMLQAAMLNGLVMLAGVILLGVPFVQLVLGDKYDPLLPLLAWFAILQALRILKSGNSVVALARAKTGNAIAGNLPRLISLPLSWYVAASGGNLLWVVLIGIAAEIVGAGISLYLLRRRARLRMRPMLWAFVTTALVYAAATAHALRPLLPGLDGVPGWATALATLVAFAFALATMRDLQTYVRRRAVTRFDE